MRVRSVTSAFVLSFLMISGCAAASSCDPLRPNAPRDFSRESTEKVDAAIEGATKRLFAANSGKLEIAYHEISADVLKQYPNADRLYLWERTIYLYCSTISESALSDVEKLNRIEQLMKRIQEPAASPGNLGFDTCADKTGEIRSKDGTAQINQLQCGNQSFSVRFLWLDHVLTSYLAIDYFDNSLKALVGNNPLVIHNEVHKRTSEIVRRFGVPLTAESELFKQVTQTEPEMDTFFAVESNKGTTAKIKNSGAANIPPSALRQLKLYLGSERILWPDLTALKTVAKTRQWPSNFVMHYAPARTDFERRKRISENAVFACVGLRRFIMRDEVENYWTEMDNLERAIMSKQLRVNDVINYSVPGSDSLKRASLNNPAVEAMAYFGEEYWPEDFLIAFGDFATSSGCENEEDYRFGFYAIPRELYTLVAVIEAQSKPLEIEGMSFFVDPQERLRTLKQGTQIERIPPGVISLNAGQSVIIPMRIELRYNLQFRPISQQLKMFNNITQAPPKVFHLTVKQTRNKSPAKPFIEKERDSFREPQDVHLTPSYVFGPSYSIRDITISTKPVAVRAVPANPLTWLGSIGGASCPFLFVKDGREEPAMVGRVLIGAIREELTRVEDINLPQGTDAVMIGEWEPEITYLQRVTIRSKENPAETLLGENIVIRPGHSNEFIIPDAYRDHPILNLRGYYQPLTLD
jgi:hypothetical protein